MAKALRGLSADAQIKLATIDLMETILAAQGSAFAAQQEQATLLQRIRELEEQMARMKTWDAEKQRYELKAIDTGAFAYMLKESERAGEPTHWLCTNCFNKGHKGFLAFKTQNTHPGGGRGHHSIWACTTCNATVSIYFTRKPSEPWEPTGAEV
jgi:hypothetical protein